MAEKENKLNTSLVTPRMRLAFACITEPKIKDDGSKSWETVMLFDGDTDMKELKKMAENAAINKWGTDKTKWPKGMKSPFRSGDEENYQKYEGFEGKVVIRAANSKNPPGIVNANLQAVIDPQEVYSGRWAKAHIRAYAYDTKGNKGVTFWLENLQLLEHDDRFGGGRARAEDVFQKETVAATTTEADDSFFA